MISVFSIQLRQFEITPIAVKKIDGFSLKTLL